jgi:4-hydroxy-tetrahydrodipicolinate reductase
MLSIAVSGRTGRVGRCVVSEIERHAHLKEVLDLEKADVVIDFSVPEATVHCTRICTAHQIPLITGTTGLSAHEQAIIQQASDTIPILQAFNMAWGVQVLQHLVAQANQMLPSHWDAHIIEAHRRDKRDAPSGTALALGRTLAPRAVHYSSLRVGDTPGEHQIWFASEGERLVLQHQISDRKSFALGALQAISWIVNQPAGLYSLMDKNQPLP